MTAYIGRFAPSPTGPLHAGSLVAALASWLDAHAHHGTWLVRVEDVDRARCSAAARHAILQQLHQHTLIPDAEPLVQSQRGALYQQALDALIARRLAYPCTCSRSQIAAALAAQGHVHARHAERVYPGTCRPPLPSANQPAAVAAAFASPQQAHAWRLHVQACLLQQGLAVDAVTHWTDRRLGAQQQAVAQAVGDFVLRRADGLWAYQLAVVVDDAAQGMTHIVRGADLADNTARQIVLQQALGLPRPQYLHTPLVCNARGEKLSKQNAAPAVQAHNAAQALHNLQTAAQVLGLPPAPPHASVPQALAHWTAAWQARWCNR